MIPAEWWQTTEMFPDTQGGVDINRADFDARAVITWSDATNQFYAYSEVFDDISAAGDTWQFNVDADHAGGTVHPLSWPEGTSEEEQQRTVGAANQQYEIWNTAGDADVIGPDETLFFWGKASWLPDQGWYLAEHTFEGTYGGEGDDPTSRSFSGRTSSSTRKIPARRSFTTSPRARSPA